MTGVPRLHLISSRQLCPLDRFPAVAAAAASGGVDAVHIREPNLPHEELVTLAEQTRNALTGSGCRLLINSELEIAKRTGVDGVHLPERGPSPSEATSLLAKDALVGVSVHSVGSAEVAEREGADYVVAGHVFETGSKPGQAGRGVRFIADVAGAVRIPVIAIGGITPENAAEVIAAGAYGIAVLSGILAASDPQEAAGRYAAVLEHGRGEQA